LRDLSAHGVTVRADLWAFTDDRDVAMHNDAALSDDETCGVVEELPRRGAAPAFVRRRKMLADVAFADSAENGVCQSMQAGIGIRVAFEAVIVWHLDAAEPDVIADGEAMNIVAHAGAAIAQTGAQMGLGQR